MKGREMPPVPKQSVPQVAVYRGSAEVYSTRYTSALLEASQAV